MPTVLTTTHQGVLKPEISNSLMPGYSWLFPDIGLPCSQVQYWRLETS
jgi:hypothetical protein